MRLAFLMTALAASPLATAADDAGKTLHDQACIACHQRMYGGDGAQMYTRAGRLLSDRLELEQRVAACNAQMNAGWFPEEEALVADYLNRQYYHFAP